MLYPLYRLSYPEDTSNVVIGQQVGQISRFLLEIKSGDYLIVPSNNTEILYYGVVQEKPYFYESDPKDDCPYRHRISVNWEKKSVPRSAFSVPFQNTMRSSLTVFKVNHENNFFTTINRKDYVPPKDLSVETNYYQTILLLKT